MNEQEFHVIDGELIADDEDLQDVEEIGDEE